MSLAPVDVETALPEPSTCTNCGFEKVDVFCARCGEKQPDHHDVTVGHFFHELLHELVHLDSKLFRTLRVVVTRPGELTAEYFAGRKKRYIRIRPASAPVIFASRKTGVPLTTTCANPSEK